MKLKKIEHIVDILIPYLLLLLAIVIAIELFFPILVIKYYTLIEVIDGSIILFFIVDLSFKYKRAKNVKDFIKRYWLEIIAVLPFYLVFRLFERTFELFGILGTKEAQQVAHIGVELEREGKLVKVAEETKFISRTERFSRFIRPILRLPRFLKATEFYEKPKRK